MEDSMNVKQRLEALIAQRGFSVSDFDTKYRGKLKTTKFLVYEASQKKHLFSGIKRG